VALLQGIYENHKSVFGYKKNWDKLTKKAVAVHMKKCSSLENSFIIPGPISEGRKKWNIFVAKFCKMKE